MQNDRPLTVADHHILLALADRFAGPETLGILLTGSYARGDAGPFSDVDLVRLVQSGSDPTGSGSYLIDGRLVTVGDVTPAGVEAWFSDPEQIIDAVQSVRDARILYDPYGLCVQVQQRAHAFHWTGEIQAKADRIAGEALVGWIEEVHKGLEGLARDDIGRLLNARFGLSWGLAHVLRVQQGILRGSDNDLLSVIADALGPESPWPETAATAFGINGKPLRAQVRAGLELYVLTAESMLTRLEEQQRTMVTATVQTIRQELNR